MIVCRSCGHQNADGAEFCASCGAYLAWDGDRVGAPAAGPAVAAPAGEVATGGTAGPPPVAGSPAGPAGAAGGHPVSPPASQPVPVTQPVPAAQPAAGPPVAQPPVGFLAVQPAPAVRLPPAEAERPPVPVRRPGALYCSACGVENGADRRLCRSCGVQLRPVAVRPVPWWRRLFGRRPAPVVGERPGRRRRARGRHRRRALRAVVAAVLVAALALLVGPGRGLVTSAYRTVTGLVTAKYEPVKPVAAIATSTAAGRQPRQAIDGVKDTAWAEDVPGPGTNQTLTIMFGRTVDLARIGITPGASDNEKKFLAQSRPERVRLVFGAGREQVVTLRNAAEFQPFDVAVTGVDRVTVVLLTAYRGQSGQDTSIAEVEFFTKG